MIEITDKVLEAAMKKAVELAVFPFDVALPTYLGNWRILEEILRAALEELEDD